MVQRDCSACRVGDCRSRFQCRSFLPERTSRPAATCDRARCHFRVRWTEITATIFCCATLQPAHASPGGESPARQAGPTLDSPAAKVQLGKVGIIVGPFCRKGLRGPPRHATVQGAISESGGRRSRRRFFVARHCNPHSLRLAAKVPLGKRDLLCFALPPMSSAWHLYPHSCIRIPLLETLFAMVLVPQAQPGSNEKRATQKGRPSGSSTCHAESLTQTACASCFCRDEQRPCPMHRGPTSPWKTVREQQLHLE